jgi:KDO2-lipid IV(A) lauroyltransferase
MIWLAKSLLYLLARWPASAPYAVARRCAGLWMALSPGKRRVAEANLRSCFPQLGPQAIGQLLKDSFLHYVCSVLETGRNRFWAVPRLQALCDGMQGVEMLTRTLASGRGVLLLAPHFGAWEYLGIYLQTLFDVAILYKPAGHPGLEQALLQMRGRGGGKMLPATQPGLRQLFAHLASGNMAAVLPDQQPSSGQGRFAPFFGLPALTGVLAPRLVQKTGCLVVFAACERLAGGRYRIHVLPADEGMYAADLDTAVAAVNRGVESCIAIDPAQYLWSYKRFRSRPAGEQSIYL